MKKLFLMILALLLTLTMDSWSHAQEIGKWRFKISYSVESEPFCPGQDYVNIYGVKSYSIVSFHDATLFRINLWNSRELIGTLIMNYKKRYLFRAAGVPKWFVLNTSGREGDYILKIITMSNEIIAHPFLDEKGCFRF